MAKVTVRNGGDMTHDVEIDAHLSPVACSRCNPLTCACRCHTPTAHTPLRTYVGDTGVSKPVMVLCSCSEYHYVTPSGMTVAEAE